MARLKVDMTIEQCIAKASHVFDGECEFAPISGTGWVACWIRADALAGRTVQAGEGQRAHPFLVRFARRAKPKNDKYLDHLELEEKRFLFLGLDASTVDDVLEAAGVGGQVVSPRVDVDRLVHDLVSPPSALVWPDPAQVPPEERGGRPYLIGSIYAGIEGYGRNMRSASFFGDDLAEAKLFKRILGRLSAYRVGVRDPAKEKEILSISGKGEVSLQTYRGKEHLAAIDLFTQFMRLNGMIDWKEIPQ